jgi:hypothetical protein
MYSSFWFCTSDSAHQTQGRSMPGSLLEFEFLAAIRIRFEYIRNDLAFLDLEIDELYIAFAEFFAARQRQQRQAIEAQAEAEARAATDAAEAAESPLESSSSGEDSA